MAKVKDRVITLGDFEKAYLNVGPEYLPDTKDLAGLKEFLEHMIHREIMGLKADELGYDKDPYVVQGMEGFRQSGLQAAYLKVKVADKLAVTDKDLRDIYDKYGTVLEVKQILADTEDEANHVYDLLQQGHDFESACKQYSKGPDASTGGKVLDAYYGQFPTHFQDELFSKKVGEVTKPIINPYGYFVIKVINSKRPTQKPFEEVKPELEKMATTQKTSKLTFELSNQIMEKHGFQWYDDNLKIIFNAMPPDQPVDNPPNRDLEVYPLLKLAVEDMEKPVASYLDKTITVKDFSDLYDRGHFYQRPRRERRLGGLRKFLADIAMNELVVVEIESSGIEGEPEVISMLNRKREDMMISRLHVELIDEQVDVREPEIEAYYKDNQELFRREEERRFSAIVTGDRASATEAWEKLSSGADFKTVARSLSVPELAAQARVNDRLLAKGQVAEIDDHGFNIANLGDISEPFELSVGWAVVRLDEKLPERIRSYDEVQNEIRHRLKTIKGGERLDQLLSKWRQEYTVEVFDKNLKKAKLDVTASSTR
ncbi:MAG: peptidyl-prolyl cis-trans isomerase [Candidatus Krumholzibacteria bacterium]|nr:peptidyl-prolyl cis-trans isomerase [Candidatus Krumholzibacteria bacterium]